MFCYVTNLQLINFFHSIGSNAETRRSNFPGTVVPNYPSDPHMISKNGDHEKSPDPYLLGRLMGSSYANYPSAFSIASRGVSNPTSSQQLLSNQNKPARGNKINSLDEPIYVPGAYMPSSCLGEKDGANDIYDFASKYRQQMRHQQAKMLMTPQG